VHYLVFGTGAVGGLVGARLALAGKRVTFLARPHARELLRTRGLEITGEGPPGRLTNPIIVTELEEAFAQTSPDLILLTVKAYDCQEAAESLQSSILDPPVVVSLLNGIGNEAALSLALGSDNVIPATMTTAVRLIEPGLLQVERQRGVGLAGNHRMIPILYNELVEAGISTRCYPDPARMKWSKLLTNIITNATTAITGMSPAQVLAHPQLFRIEVEALRETVRVMLQMGFSPQNLPGVPTGVFRPAIFLPYLILQPIMRHLLVKSRGDKLPSFNYDIGRGRSEVKWLNGAVVKKGNQLGLPTPANAVLTETLLELVEDDQSKDRFRGRPKELIQRASHAGVPGLVA
jgi:2-dehydropantoate 2-reductase